MSKRSVPYEESVLYPMLQDDEFAVGYLNECLHDEDPSLFLLALRQVTEARKMTKLAKDTKLDRAGLYRMLSEDGNPAFASMNMVLDSLGFELSVKPKQVG